MVQRILPSVLLAGLMATAFVPSSLRADDMLPPPPTDDMMLPPGGDMMPPPPGGDMMAPPPAPGGDLLPPPPGGDMMAPPAMDGGMPPPPGGDMMAPPAMGGDLMAPPGELAPPPADNMFPEAAPVAASKDDSYSVVRRDSLWKIAGKSRIYGDSFQWPLLFIANRGKIKDPDLIKPGWDLVVRRNVAADQVAQAVQKAKDTPRYQPHTAPRKKLPIDY